MRCSDDPKLSGQIQNCTDSRKVEGNEISGQKKRNTGEKGEYALSHCRERGMEICKIMEFKCPDLDNIVF